jgi:hypothetical protein
MSKILSEAGLIEAFGRMRTTHPQNSPSQQRIHLSHEALRAERDALAESRDWWRTARSDEISKDLEALVQAVTQRGSDPMSDNPDRAAIERAGSLMSRIRTWRQWGNACGYSPKPSLR